MTRPRILGKAANLAIATADMVETMLAPGEVPAIGLVDADYLTSNLWFVEVAARRILKATRAARKRRKVAAHD